MINDQITARLYVFIRENIKGGCKKFSLGDKCECPLCDLDRLLDASNQGASMNHSELIARLLELATAATPGNELAFTDRLVCRQAADALQALERVQVDLGEAQDDSKVICPNCCTQFRAIPVAVQDKLRALERVPMTEEVALKIAHRRATTYTHRSDPHYSGYAFVPYTLMDFVRDLEAHHNITPPESKG